MVWDALRDTLIKTRPNNDLLTQSIQELCERMRAVDSQFAEETDSDMLDAYIYERLALQARYRYLTRQARQRAVSEQEGVKSA